MSAYNTGALHPLAQPSASAGAPAEKRVYEPSMEEILASIRRIIADDQSLPGRGAAERESVDRDSRPPVELRRMPAPGLVESTRHEPVTEPPQAAEHAPAPILRDPPPPPLRADSAHVVSTEGREPTDAEPRAAPLAHGMVAAPQYAMPDRGPAASPEATESSEPAPLSTVHDDVYETAEAAPFQASPFQAAASESSLVPDASIEPPPSPSVEAPSLFSAATDASVSAAFNMLAASRLANNSDELMNLVRDMIRPLLRSWLDDNLPSMVERMVRAEIERVARGGR